MMKKEWLYPVYFLGISVVLSSCQGLPVNRPNGEICITGDSGLVCTLDDRTYIRPASNDICTNPKDYGLMDEYVLEIEKRLKRCLASPKRCR